MTWGASQEDWEFWITAGYGEDMLPVVSNPAAAISPKSNIKALGKTPSLYNNSREVVGIAGWTGIKATPGRLTKWRREEDYGACLQTRRAKAIDIDVEDGAKAAAIIECIEGMLFCRLPARFREGTGKCLVPLIIEGEMAKRVLRVDGGNVEFLGSGQQCVVAGTHPSGGRYQWRGLENGLPKVEIEVFEELWRGLSERFGQGEGITGAGHKKRKPKGAGQDAAAGAEDDEIIDELVRRELILGRGRGSEAWIACPWKAGHSTHSGDSETAYFPAGGDRGYEQGHFKCLHAGCLGRTDGDFIEALGLRDKEFEALGELTKAESKAAAAAKAGLDRPLKTNENGQTLAVIENLAQVLARPHLCLKDIRFDTFRDEIVYRPVRDKGEVEEGVGWIPFKDCDYTDIRLYLGQTGFLPIGRELMRDAVHHAAHKRRIDTAQEWLGGLTWDGLPRVERFMASYMGAEDSAYSRAVSLYIWTALAGRIIEPGCKADAAPIFVGEQYIGKSMAVAAMCPDERMFAEIRLDDSEDNLSRKIRGKLLVEFAELRGLHTKELEGIKAYISRRFEEWVPKYLEFITNYPRRCLFIGTSNKDELFADETGNRRWLPVVVRGAKLDAIACDRDQLWAEGAHLFRTEGIRNYYEAANELAQPLREEFFISDVWEEDVMEWVAKNEKDRGGHTFPKYIQVIDILREAFDFQSMNIKKTDEMRISKILRKNGYKKQRMRVKNRIIRGWVKA